MKKSRHEIAQFEQRYRTMFVNSLAGFRQAVLVGTKSVDHISNLAIFNSLIHLGAHPALFGLISRPDTVQRDTLQNIMETSTYTLNYVPSSLYKKAHQTSARYEKDISEFEKTGLEEYILPGINAPFVKHAIVKIAMKLEEIVPIAINGTTLIIGSIVEVELEDHLVGVDGFVNLADADTLLSQGLDAYFTASLIGRLPYAKP
jgi:flavin reductase (DIM6/NTAB) family NADH-FMN oxidoreductase RutF